MQRLTIRRYARIARPYLLEGMVPNNCIVATRITMDVLGHFGVPVRALVVEATIWNEAWGALYQEHGRVPTEAELDAADRQNPDRRPWFVILGSIIGLDGLRRSPKPNEWLGHLVAMASLNDGAEILVDPSIEQANRPEHRIHLPPVLTASVDPRFSAGTQVQPVPVAAINEPPCMVIYRLQTEADPFTVSPDWHRDHVGYTSRLIHALVEQTGSLE